MVDGLREYYEKWQRHDPSRLVRQYYDVEYLKDLLRPDVEDEVYVEVTEALKVELANLKLALEMEAGKKGGKGKKGKPEKGGKGKKKGLSMGTDALKAELVSEGLIRAYPEAKMGDFVGSMCFLPHPPDPDIAPDYAQLRQALTCDVVIPTGHFSLRTKVLSLPQTVLLYGAPGVGKTLLARAIATSLGASWFDLSPKAIEGHFPGKQITTLLQMIFEIAKAEPPAVVYIDQAELVMGGEAAKGKGKKKAAAAAASASAGGENPGRSKKDLLAQLKSLDGSEGIIVLGCATNTAGNEKNLTDFFDRCYYVPCPDYNTRIQLIDHFLAKLGARRTVEAKTFNVSALARLSEGLSGGQLEAMMKRVLTPSRVRRLDRDALDVSEFLTSLSLEIPNFELEQSYHKIRERLHPPPKTPEQLEAEALAAEEKKAKKGKKGKKKK